MNVPTPGAVGASAPAALTTFLCLLSTGKGAGSGKLPAVTGLGEAVPSVLPLAFLLMLAGVVQVSRGVR